MEKFEELVMRIIERERKYAAAIHEERDASKSDELKGAIIAIRNILVDAAEIRHLKGN